MALPVYQPGEAKAYCESKGWAFRTSGDHLVLANCPICGRGGYKFYLNNTSGLWDDKHGSCGQKGNFYQLQKSQGDEPEIKRSPMTVREQESKASVVTLAKYQPRADALSASEKAKAYLASRGITEETAKAWHLGFKTTEDGIDTLMIPYVKGKNVVDVKYRVLPEFEDGKRPKYWRHGGESILFGEHTLSLAKKEGRSTIYVVEGEFDAMTLWQHGYWPALTTTTGASSFKAEWYDQIKEFKPDRIVVCYDSDVAGQKGAEKFAKQFEEFAVANLVLDDAKDLNEYFQSHTKDDFDALLESCHAPEIEECKSMAIVNNMLEEQLFFSTDAFDGLKSQFDDFNNMTEGGYWNGQLVIVTGPSGTGKTSFVLQDFLHFAKLNEPAYLICLEMPEIMMMRKIYTKEFGIPMLKLTQEHVREGRKTLDKLPLYLGNKCRKLSDVEKTIRAAVSRYGLKIVAFDNLNYFVRSIEHSTQELAATTKLLKELAVDLNIPIVAIAQPKKFDKDNRVMSAFDLKDSSAIEQDADTIVILHRQRIKTEVKDFGKSATGFHGNQSPFTLFRVEKARYAAGGEAYLYFEGARSMYRELTEAEKTSMQNAA